jgi:hypothetical protein
MARFTTSKALGPLVVAPRLGGLIVVGARFEFDDRVVFRGVRGPLDRVMPPPVPPPKKLVDPLAVVFSNNSAL